MSDQRPVVVDPSTVGNLAEGLEATNAVLTHCRVDLEAIRKCDTRVHEIARAETAAKASAAGAPPKLTAWARNIPCCLRPSSTGGNDPASDHDRANYLGMIIAIDYRHWIAGSGGGQTSAIPIETTQDTLQTVDALKPYGAVDPLQFWYHSRPSSDNDGAATWCRGSMAMTTSLKDAVDGPLAWHWYRPAELAEAPRWNDETAAKIMTYRMQVPPAAPPTVSEDGVASWPEVPIPALPERVAMLREIGASLARQGLSFYDLAVQSGRRLYNNGAGFIERLLQLHPRYMDVGHLSANEGDKETRKVFLLKLAQLTVTAFYESRMVFADASPFDFTDFDKLHVCPDYQLPKALRSSGLLLYSDRLAQLVDGRMLLPAGSPEEVELRVATMVAAKALCEALNAAGTPTDMATIDFVLWLAGREATSSQHHLTITHRY